MTWASKVNLSCPLWPWFSSMFCILMEVFFRKWLIFMSLLVTASAEQVSNKFGPMTVHTTVLKNTLELRWDLPYTQAKSPYLVFRGYANFCKMVWMTNLHLPRFRIKHRKFSEIPKMVSMDVSNCYPYQFLEICIPLCNDPIRIIQKGHLKDCKD